jgi:hypothetical protein
MRFSLEGTIDQPDEVGEGAEDQNTDDDELDHIAKLTINHIVKPI